jgi:ferredoxin
MQLLLKQVIDRIDFKKCVGCLQLHFDYTQFILAAFCVNECPHLLHQE